MGSGGTMGTGSRSIGGLCPAMKIGVLCQNAVEKT